MSNKIVFLYSAEFQQNWQWPWVCYPNQIKYFSQFLKIGVYVCIDVYNEQ